MNWSAIFNTKIIMVTLMLLMSSAYGAGEGDCPEAVYWVTEKPISERVDDLVSRMTLKEKVSQMRDNAAGIPRLGIPSYAWWNECLHGVARSGQATVFPQAIGMAATWNPDLIYSVADGISTEARAKNNIALENNNRKRYYGLTMWSPNINLFRDPRWGRGQETYGEDPHLTGELAVAFIRGLQGRDEKYFKVIATPKHFAVHSGPEPSRHSFNAETDERTLQEYYLPAFKRAVQEGRAFSVMGAYNRFRGDSCCAHTNLLQEILRDDWGFGGYVVSDCGAIFDIYARHKIVKTPAEAAAIAVKSGCDLNCGGVYPALINAVKQGLITEEQVDVSVKRLMEARFRLGMFDPPEIVAYRGIGPEELCSPENKQLALKTAQESIVLLKNKQNTLPLGKDLKRIAVIGPNAADTRVLLGNYHGTPEKAVSVLEGIRQAVGPDCDVSYVQGCNLVGDTEPPLKLMMAEVLSYDGKPGLHREFFGSPDLTGDVLESGLDEKVDLNWNQGNPFPNQKITKFSIRWSGTLTAPQSGAFKFALSGDDGFRLKLDGKAIINDWRYASAHTVKSKVIDLEAGEKYPIVVEYFQGSREASIKLEWMIPLLAGAKSGYELAAEAAENADAVIMVGGLSPTLEGEEMRVSYEGFAGGDRTAIELPASQRKLLEAVSAAGKPVVLVLLNGSAVALPWASGNVPAIVEAWYPGQAGGTAVADVLFGNYNPSGRLPLTFYASTADLPPFEDYQLNGRTYMYFEGKPLYPFGHGLSYSSFEYSASDPQTLELPADGRVAIKFDLKNNGSFDGDEVVQLYARSLNDPDGRIKKLIDFKRLHVKAGTEQQVTFAFQASSLSRYNVEKKAFEVLPGNYELQMGSSSADIRQTIPLVIK